MELSESLVYLLKHPREVADFSAVVKLSLILAGLLLTRN